MEAFIIFFVLADGLAIYCNYLANKSLNQYFKKD